MRFIVDANVVVSAALSKFPVPFRALELVLDHNTSLISDETFTELKATLYKPKFDKHFLLEDTRLGILSTILKCSAIIIPTV
jgi:predicted nucleic acid-binding protein